MNTVESETKGRVLGWVPDRIRGATGDWGGKLTLAYGAFVLAHLLFIIFLGGEDKQIVLICNIATIVIYCGPFVLAWRVSTKTDLPNRTRNGWRLISLAYLAFIAGSLLWLYYENIAGTNAFPSLADAGYLMYYPLMLCGLLSLVAKLQTAKERLKLALDTCIVLIGGGMILWYLLLKPIAEAHTGDNLTMVLSLAYPIGDLVLLLGISSLILRRSSAAGSRPVKFVLAGIVLNFIADVAFTYQTLQGVSQTANFVDALFTMSCYPVMLGAHYQYLIASRYEDPATTSPPKETRHVVWLPYVAIALAYGVILKFVFEQSDAIFIEFIVTAVVLTALVIARQVMTMQENAKANTAIIASEDRYRQLFESHPVPMWVYDHETLAFLQVNDAATDRYGFSREEFLGMTLKDIRPSGDIPALLADVSKRSQGFKDAASWVHRKKDGTLIDVEIRSYGLVFDGRLAEIVLIDDVTERKRLQAESAIITEIIHGVASTSNLDELLDLIHRSIGKMLCAKNCFVALYDEETMLFSLPFFADQFDEAPPASEFLKTRTRYVFETEKPILMTAEISDSLVAQDQIKLVGTPPKSWLGTPLRTPTEVIGVLVVQNYEDENAYSERDLEFLKSVGNQVALAIDRKRAEDKLKIFNEKLQRSNRELQDFAYVASHDLQEPLRKVQTFSDRLCTKYADKLEGDGLDYLERMRGAAERMRKLIQDLLIFSRVSSKAQPFVPVDLEEIAHEVLSDLEVKIEETGAKVELRDLPTVEADPSQMRQLIQNLVGNALKFRRPDITPVVKITASTTNGNGAGEILSGHFCTIRVEDNGIGFEEKYIDKIFTVFQRLHGRAEYEGSGIGLAVCRKIAERHRGSITAKSRPGEGSAFVITLPIEQSNSGMRGTN
jgi:PAS domain S-box-containing protein